MSRNVGNYCTSTLIHIEQHRKSVDMRNSITVLSRGVVCKTAPLGKRPLDVIGLPLLQSAGFGVCLCALVQGDRHGNWMCWNEGTNFCAAKILNVYIFVYRTVQIFTVKVINVTCAKIIG
jgi:hypothetical protein